jgi:hypothetical protein
MNNKGDYQMRTQAEKENRAKSKQVDSFFDGLDNGSFKIAIGTVLTDLCRNVLHCDKAGSITLKFDVKTAIGDDQKVTVAHSIKSKIPTKDGSRGEDYMKATSFYLDADFNLSRAPRNQGSLITEDGDVADKGTYFKG